MSNNDGELLEIGCKISNILLYMVCVCKEVFFFVF